MRAWLKEQGFPSADLRSEAEMDLSHLSEWPVSSLDNWEYAAMHPVACACHKGELQVLKWLCAHGAAGDPRGGGPSSRRPFRFRIICVWRCGSCRAWIRLHPSTDQVAYNILMAPIDDDD